MERIKNKVKEIVCDKNLYIFLFITILFFGAMYRLQYAPDTYNVFTNTLKTSVKHFLSCGRFVTGIAMYGVRGILHIGNEGTYLLSYGFAIICTVISLYKLNKLVKKEVKHDLISILITTLIIINPFSLELYVYIEKGILMLSVLLCVLAVEQIEKFLKGNKKTIRISNYIYVASKLLLPRYSRNIGSHFSNLHYKI